MTTPTVTENPLRLTPVDRDQFLPDQPSGAAATAPKRRPQDA